MSEELKTLKDIKIRKPRGLELPYIDWYKEELKEEAIKWVKNWLKASGNPGFSIYKDFCIGFKKIDMDRMNITQGQACASIGAFVNFFNIAEQDLK